MTVERRQSKRYSTSAMYMSMGGVDSDLDIPDALSQAQKHLTSLKSLISIQSKKNFLLEKDVRYLDARIALLIQNKMGVADQDEVASRLDAASDSYESQRNTDDYFPHRKTQDKYANLFFLLQSEPQYIASLCTLVSMSEIDSLLQTVMFTIYGNQYEQREENLLLSMFQSVLAHQFENTSEFSSLLRANTPVSRMMTTYTRRGPGQTYIRAALIKNLSQIIDSQENLEINPIEVYQEIHANDGTLNLSYDAIAEVVAQDHEVNARICERTQRLVNITRSILDDIMATIDQVPYGIRWICKQIRLLARRKYPEVPNAPLFSLIGAFFFLRFINPAIVTPQTYMLIDKVPPATTRRTLTLVAKMLQNLANKPTYTKETYMDVPIITDFIEDRKTSVNEFLNELCEVPDFYETLEMDQYIALSKRDIEIGITLNEILGMHGLLQKYHTKMKQSEIDRTAKALETTLPTGTNISTILRTSYPDSNPNDGLFNISHLTLLLEELGPAPTLVPRQNNASITLPLFSKWASPLSEETLDPSNAFLPTAVPFLRTLARPDVVFMELKTLMINIIRSYPSNHSILQRPLDLNAVATHAASSSDINLVKRGIKALDLLSELFLMTETYVTSSEDPALLVDEIEYELTQLGSLLQTVEEESISLEKVLKVIGEHNEYLHSQLETYRSYLRNVRNGGNQQGQPSLQQRYIDEAMANQKKSNYTKLPKLNIFSSSNHPQIKIPNNALFLSKPETEVRNSVEQFQTGGYSPADDYISLYTDTSAAGNQNSNVINSGLIKGTSKKFTLTQLSTLGIVVWHRFPVSRVPAINNHSELALTRDQSNHKAYEPSATPTTPTAGQTATSSNLYMYIHHPTPASFLISLYFKNRTEPILNVDFRLDDLLELKDTGVEVVDLVCIGLGVRALIAAVTKMSKRK